MVAVSRPSELIFRLKHNTKWQSCLLAYIDAQYYLARSRQQKKEPGRLSFLGNQRECFGDIITSNSLSPVSGILLDLGIWGGLNVVLDIAGHY